MKDRSGSQSQSLEYGEALLAYYEKDWSRALRLAGAAVNQSVWLHEARLLKGDIDSRLAEEAFQKGKYEEARKHLEAGAKEYFAAENIARSDPALYESQCSLWRTVMEIQFATGEEARASYERSNAACRNALVANADSATAYNQLAQTSWRWGEHLFEIGDDPTAAFTDAIELSRKAQILEPGRATGFYIMGTAYGYLADYELRIGKDPSKSLDESIRALLLAIEKDPRNESSYTNLGVSYFSQGAEAMLSGQESKPFFLKAIDAYRKSFEVTPTYNALVNLGNAFTQVALDAVSRGEDPTPYFRQSIEQYEGALKLNPNHWLVLTNLSSAYVARMQYEVEHGRDVTDSFNKVISLCEQSLKLNPKNPYPTVNSANGYLSLAEYKAAQGADPREWIAKANAMLVTVTEAEMPEIFLALASSNRLEAEYLVSQKRNPARVLAISRKHLLTAASINPQEYLVPSSYARLNMIQAEWEMSQHRSPDATLKIAEAQLDETLKLNPRSAAAYSMRAEIELMRVQWKESQKQPCAPEIEAGLAAINRAIQMKGDAGEAYSIRARLLLHQAAALPASRPNLAAEAVKNFERAFALNPLIQTRDITHLTKARSHL